uniref:Wound-induced protein 1 n=1 Tax=Oryza meridionalis TaxID=40149 RepID=A0A0E0EGG6_9ORYZ
MGSRHSICSSPLLSSIKARRSKSLEPTQPTPHRARHLPPSLGFLLFNSRLVSSRSNPTPGLASQELASRQDQLLLLHQRDREEEDDDDDDDLEESESESEQQRNQWLVIRLYEAINGRDHGAAHALLAPDLEWWYHGPPASHHMMRLLTGCASPSSSSFRFRPLSVHALPASDVVIAEGVTGRYHDSYWVHAWTVGNGVITHLREYLNTDLTVTRLPPTRCLWQSHRPDLPALLLAL